MPCAPVWRSWAYDLTREDLDEAFARFKELADRKREITDRDLEAIVSEQVQQPVSYTHLTLPTILLV